MKPLLMPDEQWNYAQKYGQLYGVPPEFLASIAQHETVFGTLGWGRESQGSYILGYGAYSDTSADPVYSGVENQFKYAARQISDFFSGKPYSADNVAAFAAGSWKPGDPSSWADSVYRIFSGLVGGAEIVQPPAGSGTGTGGGSRGSGSAPSSVGGIKDTALAAGVVAVAVIVALILILYAGVGGVVSGE